MQASSGEADWNLKKAAHLLRRTTFGFTPAQLQQALNDGRAKTVERLLSVPAGFAGFEREVEALTSREPDAQQTTELWLYRMINSPHPLLEKIALFWYEYFPRKPKVLEEHVRLLRTNALGDFRKLQIDAAPQAVATTICRWLTGIPGGMQDGNIARLVESFLSDFDSGKLIAVVLRSDAFFSPAAYRRKVKTPVEFALSVAMTVNAQVAPGQLHAQIAALGQRLPEPSGERQWLNAYTRVGRSNLAGTILSKVERYPDRRSLIDTMLQNDAPAEVLQRLNGLDGRDLVHAIANLQEFQLA